MQFAHLGGRAPVAWLNEPNAPLSGFRCPATA